MVFECEDKTSKIGALRPCLGGDQETVQITASNGWRAVITLDNVLGGAEGRRSLVVRSLSVILTLRPKFLNNRVRSYYVDL